MKKDTDGIPVVAGRIHCFTLNEKKIVRRETIKMRLTEI